MAVKAGRFGPGDYHHYSWRFGPSEEERMKMPGPLPARLERPEFHRRPERLPTVEKALRGPAGRRWLAGRAARMQAIDDMRPRESRVLRRRERSFDTSCPATDQLKGCIPQMNATGTFERRSGSLPDLRRETVLPGELYQAERPRGQVPFMPSFHPSRFPAL